jgi:hypothetical protein
MRTPHEDWTNAPALYEGDFAAWLKSLGPKARERECIVRWIDLGPFTHSAYGMHRDMIAGYQYLLHKGNAPAELPQDCTPEGFYRQAVQTRREQIGLHNPFTPTPYERLSEFSHFIYRRITDRLAAAAGFDKPKASTLADRMDGLDFLQVFPSARDDQDDGLGDGLDDGIDDGLGDSLSDGLDEAL